MKDLELEESTLRMISSPRKVTVPRVAPVPAAPVARGSAASPLDDQPMQSAPIAQTYDIIRTLGEGGMGRVLEVTHRRLGKRMALKLIRPGHLAQPRTRRAFVREARLASRLSHPNIVSVFDVAEDPEQGVYMIMELVEGRPLMEKLAAGRLPVRVALDILAQVADALAYVHAQGVVHMDLKPENVLLVSEPTQDRRRERVKLLDFGLARPSGQVPTTPKLDGTPHYIAPERILRTAGEPTPSMDVYALGVLAYELLTGQPPFDGTLAEVLNGHIDRMPPSFASRGVNDIDPQVEAFVRKALAKQPDGRHKDAKAFLYEARALKQMLAEPARPPRTSTPAIGKDELLFGSALLGAPWPAAVIEVSGKIRCANPAFARFLTEDGAAVVEGKQLDDYGFARVYPAFSGDAFLVSGGAAVAPLNLRLPSERGERQVTAMLSRAGDAVLLLLVAR